MITHTSNQFYADTVVYNTFHILIKMLLYNSQKTHNVSMGLLKLINPIKGKGTKKLNKSQPCRVYKFPHSYFIEHPAVQILFC
jgi:hypothetical protein